MIAKITCQFTCIISVSWLTAAIASSPICDDITVSATQVTLQRYFKVQWWHCLLIAERTCLKVFWKIADLATATFICCYGLKRTILRKRLAFSFCTDCSTLILNCHNEWFLSKWRSLTWAVTLGTSILAPYISFLSCLIQIVLTSRIFRWAQSCQLFNCGYSINNIAFILLTSISRNSNTWDQLGPILHDTPFRLTLSTTFTLTGLILKARLALGWALFDLWLSLDFSIIYNTCFAMA